MALIPAPTHSTVRKIYELHEQKRDSVPRPYLGASEIGERCARRLWYSFRWLGEAFDGRMLRLVRSAGDRFEERIIDELRAIGVRVEGQQHEVIFANGHGGGHLDGALLGLEEGAEDLGTCSSAKTAQCQERSSRPGTTKGVRAANPRHFAQMHGLHGPHRAWSAPPTSS
jgi:hypothetical protein